MATIEDMPTEVLEKLAPDLEPETVSNLKLVSKRFYSTFSSERFHRCYSRTDKPYLSELKSEARGHGVKEVVEKIKTEEVTRWRGFYELEEAHRSNWRTGKFEEEFDELPLPPDEDLSDVSFQHLHDDNLEHWLLCAGPSSKHVCLFNVTSKPRLIASLRYQVLFDCAWLLPGQVVVGDCCLGCGLFDVFDIVRVDGDFKLRFKCLIDSTALHAQPTPGVNHGTERRCDHSTSMEYAVVTGDGISVLALSPVHDEMRMYNGFGPRNGIHVWNLTTGKKIATFDLWERVFSGSWRLYASTAIRVNKGVFPYVTVTLEDERTAFVNIFNVLTSELIKVSDAELSGEDVYHLSATCMYGDYIAYRGHNTLALSGRVDEFFCIASCSCLYHGKLLLQREEESFLGAILARRCLIVFSQADAESATVYGLRDAEVAELFSFSLESAGVGYGDLIEFVEPDLLVFFGEESVWTVVSLKGEVMCRKVLENLKPVRSKDLLRSASRLYVFTADGGRSARIHYF